MTHLDSHPAAAPAPRPPPSRPGFTLVELLVVLGIISLLIAILLPAVHRVRESGRRAVCLANIAHLTKATLLYAQDNRDYLPDAGTGNTPDAYVSPRATGLPAWSPVKDGVYVLPSIGAALARYVGHRPDIWRCPSAPDDQFRWSGPDPYSGTSLDDDFKPHFKYMASKENIPAIPAMGGWAVKYRVEEWIVRNAAGLKTTRIRAHQPPAKVVLWFDRNPNFHASRKADIYANQEADYFASYGYLDGHADAVGYRNFDQYLDVFHGPIPQAWFGKQFAKEYAKVYAGE
jgi:prepilin-type N-terminal cleavage/methylation domain-containing protein